MPSRLGHARAGSSTGRAWPCPGWASYGRGWARKEPCKSRAELARDRHGMSIGHAWRAGIGRVTPAGQRPGQDGQRLGRAEGEPGRQSSSCQGGQTGQAGPWRQRPNPSPRRAGKDRTARAKTGRHSSRAKHANGSGPSTPTGRGQACQQAGAMPVASRTGTTPGSMAAAESPSRYPGARRSGVDRQATARTAETAPQWPHPALLISLATRVTNRWPASQRGYKDRLRELPEGRGDHAAGLGG